MSELKGLRDDVYRRPLATALDRLGLGAGWRCVDVGAGGGDVSVALAEMVGRGGRVYAVDSDPLARDEVARAAAAHAQVIALTQAGEDLSLPEEVDLAFCRFLLLHVLDPDAVVAKMATTVTRRAAGLWRKSRSRRPVASGVRQCRCRMHDIPMSVRCCRRWSGTRRSKWSTPGRKHRRASVRERCRNTWSR